MEEVFKGMADAIGELQAQGIANSTMLEALVMSHPDPAALRRAWHQISSPRIADNATDAATKAREVDGRLAWHFEKWNRKLDTHHPGAGTPGASPHR